MNKRLKISNASIYTEETDSIARKECKPYSERLKILELSTLQRRFEYHGLKLVAKALSDQIEIDSITVKPYLGTTSERHGPRIAERDMSKLKNTWARRLMENSITVTSARTWNRLPLRIRKTYKDTDKHLSEIKAFISDLKDTLEGGVRANSLDARI